MKRKGLTVVIIHFFLDKITNNIFLKEKLHFFVIKKFLFHCN